MDDSQIARIKGFCVKKYGRKISDSEAKEIKKNLISLAKAVIRYQKGKVNYEK